VPGDRLFLTCLRPSLSGTRDAARARQMIRRVVCRFAEAFAIEFRLKTMVAEVERGKAMALLPGEV
jgi:hypothetical protein